MPVDNAVKRGSAFTLRRLPWFRRFALPMPDGEIDQADRQQVGWVYAGILAGELVVPTYFAAEFIPTEGASLTFAYTTGTVCEYTNTEGPSVL